jgi:hypothetical protein
MPYGIEKQNNERDDVSELPEKGSLARWLIDHSGGLVQNEKTAVIVLLVLVVACILVTLGLIFKETYPTKPAPPPDGPRIPSKSLAIPKR